MFNVFILQPIFNLLLVIYSLIPGGDFGVAIIIFTVIVRLALYPLLKKQLHQTKAMQKMQPELARIKREAKGDKQVESIKMLELYKTHDIKPMRSFLILLIQLPIFIALYQVIQIFTQHRDQISHLTYGFLKNIGFIQNIISNPNHLNETFLGIINLTKSAISANSVNFAVLAVVIISAALQYYIMKQTTPKVDKKRKLRDIMREAADGKEADQNDISAAMTGSMTKFMPIMMFFIMIPLPGAVVFYYMVSNIIAVIQQHIVLKEDTDELLEVSNEKITQHKKATAKARAKQAEEADIIRITAKDDSGKIKRKGK